MNLQAYGYTIHYPLMYLITKQLGSTSNPVIHSLGQLMIHQ